MLAQLPPERSAATRAATVFPIPAAPETQLKPWCSKLRAISSISLFLDANARGNGTSETGLGVAKRVFEISEPDGTAAEIALVIKRLCSSKSARFRTT